MYRGKKFLALGSWLIALRQREKLNRRLKTSHELQNLLAMYGIDCYCRSVKETFGCAKYLSVKGAISLFQWFEGYSNSPYYEVRSK
jgi:hypothetical protein